MPLDTILVVDNDHQYANYIAGEVLPDLGFLAHIANSGETAISLLKENEKNICLMLLNWQLGAENAEVFLQRLSELGITIDTIILTDDDKNKISLKSFRLGVRDFLAKPIEIDTLTKTIERILITDRLQAQKSSLVSRLRDQYIWLSQMTDAGRYLTSSLCEDELLVRALELGLKITKADQGSISLYDQETGRLVLRAVKQNKTEAVYTTNESIKNVLMDQVVAEGKPYCANELHYSDDLSQDADDGLVKSSLHVPLCLHNEVIGVISMSRLHEEKLSNQEEAKLTYLADYTAIALRNAEQYQEAADEVIRQRQIRSDYKLHEDRFALAVSGIKAGVWDWDLSSNQIYYAPSWKSLCGYQEEDIVNSIHDWLDKVHPQDLGIVKFAISTCLAEKDGNFECEYRILNKDGSYHWMHNQATVLRDNQGNPLRMVGTQVDITCRKQAEDNLLYNAFTDALTGLASRALFVNRLEHAINRYRRKNTIFAVLVLEIDQFSKISESYGKIASDRALINVGGVLGKRLRSNDTLAHFGDGRFAFLLEELLDEFDASRVSENISGEFEKPIIIDGNSIHLKIFGGIVFNLTGYQRAEDIIRDAEVAMVSARNNKAVNISVFSPQLREHLLAEIEDCTEIQRALENDEFVLYYQPIIGFESGELIGFEALIRWMHPERGVLPPGEFIHVAEENGLIQDIDRWVLKHACNQISEWHQKSIADQATSVSVNVNAGLINDSGFLDYVENILLKSSLNPSNLVVEITERSMIENNETTIQLLSRLLELGVQVQIDDFGVGYSSLGYLSNLPMEGLKLDRSFVGGIMNDNRQREIVSAIISLTARLDVCVIAEGIETQEQMDYLKGLGCSCGQGFLISEPLSSGDVPLWLQMNFAQLQS